MPLFSVCIPAYNRANYLPALLDSILAQDFNDFEILICEDDSPERSQISSSVAGYIGATEIPIRYEENPKNLGYDGNIRRLVELAAGDFCVFMGNDDLMCPGALTNLAAAIKRHPNTGVVVRSYASFEASAESPKQVFKYFPTETHFPAGADAIAVGFRRSVVISGMTIRTDVAQSLSTNQFDGSLLYQLYLVGCILKSKDVVFTPEIIALRRDGTPPDFGNSDTEKGKFVPQDQTPESSVHFMKSMFEIAKFVETKTGLPVFNRIQRDIGNYSYPILSIQAHQPKRVFFNYTRELMKLGLWKYPLFHAYSAGLVVLGADRMDQMITAAKRRLGATPQLGIKKN